MEFICPHCSQHLESEEDIAGASVECPSCGKAFVATPPGAESAPAESPPERTSESELDSANAFLERAIGNVLHAIWGIIRRIGHVMKWFALRLYDVANWLFRLLIDIIKFFFSIRFLKFLVLLVFFAMVIAIFAGIIVAPFFLSIWFLHGRPVAATKDLLSMPFFEAVRLMWRTAAIWLKGAGLKDDVYATAWIVEGIWFVFIAGWGAWKGVKSYKRGVISRWRERRRMRKAERRARKAEQRAAREAENRANA